MLAFLWISSMDKKQSYAPRIFVNLKPNQGPILFDDQNLKMRTVKKMKDVRKAFSPPENIQHFTTCSFFNLSFFRFHEIQIHWPNSIWILIPSLLLRSELTEERLKQCCGSGSESVGSVWFGPPGSGSFHHQANIVRKTLIPTVLWPLFDFLFLKNDVNVRYLQKVISRKTFFYISFLLASILKVNDENSRIRIRIH